MSIATVSLITQAATYSTVNAVNGSGMWFQSNSASYSTNNFKYIFDLFQKDILTGAVVQSLGQYIEPPRPFNPISGLIGTGLMNPYKALRSVINNQPDWPITIQGIVPVTQSYVRYGIDYGWSYDPGYTFTTYNQVIFFQHFLGLTGIDASQFLSGDQITINMSTTLYNPQYNTTTNVIAVGANSITTDIPYGFTPSTIESGTIINQQRIVGTAGDYYGWNGTRQYQEGGGNYADFGNEFVLISLTGGSNFLTNYESVVLQPFGGPTPHPVKPTVLGQYETIGFFRDPSATINTMLVTVFDASGNEILGSGTFQAVTFSTDSRKFELGVGTQNLIDAYAVDFTGAYYYQVGFYDFITLTHSILRGNIARRIDHDCNPCYYDTIQLTWLNRRGSYEYYTFNKDSQRSIQVTKNEWMNNMSWDYNQGDRINSVLSQDVEIDYTINSNFVSQYDQNWVEELISSPEVYVISGTNRIPVVLNKDSAMWVTKTYVRDQIFNLKIDYKMAFPLNTQDA